MVSIEIKGMDNFLKGIENYSNETIVAVREAIADASLQIVKKAKENLIANGSVVHTGPNGKTVNTNTLVNSVRAEIRPLSSEIGSEVKYAPYVEHIDFSHKGRIPFLGPAVEDTRESFSRDLKNAIKND